MPCRTRRRPDSRDRSSGRPARAKRRLRLGPRPLLPMLHRGRSSRLSAGPPGFFPIPGRDSTSARRGKAGCRRARERSRLHSKGVLPAVARAVAFLAKLGAGRDSQRCRFALRMGFMTRGRSNRMSVGSLRERRPPAKGRRAKSFGRSIANTQRPLPVLRGRQAGPPRDRPTRVQKRWWRPCPGTHPRADPDRQSKVFTGTLATKPATAAFDRICLANGIRDPRRSRSPVAGSTHGSRGGRGFEASSHRTAGGQPGP